MKRFVALFKANIQETIEVNNSVFRARIEPVFENGFKFSGDVFMSGLVNEDSDEEFVLNMCTEHIKNIEEFVVPVKLEFRETTDTYRFPVDLKKEIDKKRNVC